MPALPATGHPVIEAWVRSLRDLRCRSMPASRSAAAYHKAYALVERVQFIERHLASRQGGLFAAPARIGRTGE